ncbi:shikimate dehydrogenase [Magnetococcus marinus MC-1]|uniref:Shikimate dehydrogenase (NADP(+)) n=2 Tax=Magnetococcus TaxID=162171 RepID=AROE_MAGMM|nr:RecName: Full=Shikimate dehydrogenase (NADP(+)); Short=SDH [Magnetococcus marinus MC-1]ABK42551.1 shikimate dehydrogenase [Magnetococcus marinus MC-1]
MLSKALNINGETGLLAVIGDPVSHSLSPKMHNLALRHCQLNYCYVALPVKPHNLVRAVQGFAAMGMRGFNATIPHKENLLPLMHTLSEEASHIGAVNTVVIDDDGKMTGHNTDAYGFITGLKEAWRSDLSGLTAIMLGSGGAARAILYGLIQAKAARVIIANRTIERAQALIEAMQPYAPNTQLMVAPTQADQLPLESCDLLINTTSMGLKGETIPYIDLARLPHHAFVSDIVYGAHPTPLLRATAQHQLGGQDGLPMLIHQGAKAFELWTGHSMPVELVEHTLRQ